MATLPTRENELYYLAGIFDGEGCITIFKVRCNNRKSSHKYGVRCRVGMSSPMAVSRFHTVFGGYIVHEEHKNDPHKRDMWVWDISHTGAYEFLNTIAPYLILKKGEAELGIKFRESVRVTGPNGYTEEELAVKEAQYTLMRNLKKCEEVI